MRRPRTVAAAVWAAAGLLGLAGCGSDPGRAPNAAPGATYTGPRHLYNTVGSLARLSNNRPQVVSGYGLVVGLENTGSSEVPQALRQWLINEMTKQGVGRQRNREVLDLGPEQVLASDQTAVVRVVGIIPPGAVGGSRFDLLVTAADTSTTSLVGGRLWTTELSAGGTNPDRLFLTPLAEARGPVYLGPTDAVSRSAFELDENRRTALVVAGGEVLASRGFELVLNQPNRTRARLIAERINELYRQAPSDELPTANALSPLVIQLNLPARYADRPQLFVDLVMNTFVDRSPGFAAFKAEELAAVLREDPTQASSVTLAWKALGPTARTTLSNYYGPTFVTASRTADGSTGGDTEPAPTPLYLRLAALEAGAFVGDERASPHLLELAGHEEPSVRVRVAEALVSLPDSRNGNRALRTLLDDPVRSVRIAAYEALALTGSPLVERTVLRDRLGEIKLVIDRLPVRDPLIYITQKRYPRLVIFNPQLGFDPPTLASVWDGRLMVRRAASDQPAEIFYQFRDPEQDFRVTSEKHRISPTVATLAYVLAHRPTAEDPQDGFDLTYGEVADAVYQLARVGAFDADVEIDRSRLARLLDSARGDGPTPGQTRPETAPTPGNAPGNAPGSGPSASR
ncbi:MAG: flagellar basal body P-ring protein FlgI [Planctomycetota bacterium]